MNILPFEIKDFYKKQRSSHKKNQRTKVAFFIFRKQSVVHFEIELVYSGGVRENVYFLCVSASSSQLLFGPCIMPCKQLFFIYTCSGHLLFCLFSICSLLLLARAPLFPVGNHSMGFGWADPVPTRNRE